MPVMFSALLASAETLINGLLAHDPASPARLAQLAGQRLSLRLERPSLAVLVHFDTHGVTLLAQHEPEEAEETTRRSVYPHPETEMGTPQAQVQAQAPTPSSPRIPQVRARQK